MRRSPAPGSAGRRGEGVRITSPPTLLLGSLSTDIQETLRTNTERAGVRRRPPPAAPPSTPALLTHRTHCCRSEPQLDARRRGREEGRPAPVTSGFPRWGGSARGRAPARGRWAAGSGGRRGGGPRAADNGGNRWAAGRSGRVTSGTSGRGSCGLGPADPPPPAAPAGGGVDGGGGGGDGPVGSPPSEQQWRETVNTN